MVGVSKQIKRQIRTKRRYRRWQSILLFGYACFFAGILPFICWGNWAEPGHPHQGPHFVFADPVVQPMEHPSGMVMVTSPDGEAHDHQVAAAEEAATGASSLPAGQARPATLMAELLLLLFVRLILLIPRKALRYIQIYPMSRMFSHRPAVPTPPPRLRVGLG